MVGDILGAQLLLGLILLTGVVLGLLHQRWPGPGRALVRGVERLLVGWEPRHIVGTVLVGCVVFVLTAYCVAPR